MSLLRPTFRNDPEYSADEPSNIISLGWRSRLTLPSMRIHPVHTWWLGVGLFTPSILTWVIFLGIYIYKGMFSVSIDWHSIKHLYLPLLAAVVGVAAPLLCMRFLRHASWRFTGWAFSGYLAVMLTWGIIEIRYEHYQIGGHDYPNGPRIDGHKYYWHGYYTWYFIPYRWIEHGTGIHE